MRWQKGSAPRSADDSTGRGVDVDPDDAAAAHELQPIGIAAEFRAEIVGGRNRAPSRHHLVARSCGSGIDAALASWHGTPGPGRAARSASAGLVSEAGCERSGKKGTERWSSRETFCAAFLAQGIECLMNGRRWALFRRVSRPARDDGRACYARSRRHGTPNLVFRKPRPHPGRRLAVPRTSTSTSAPRDRLALIGRNGAGKTTLLKCLAGTIDTDEGRRTIVPGTRVVLLEQDPDHDRLSPRWRTGCWAGERPPEAHEAAAIADQIGIDLTRPTRDRERRRAAAGGDRPRAGAGARRAAARRADQPSRSRRDRLARRVARCASRAPSSSSATTAPSSPG